MNQVRFARLARLNQRYGKAVFCRKQVVHNFGQGKRYPAALQKIPTQTVDSSQVSAKCIRQRQQRIIKSITNNWDKNTVTDLEPVCPKQDNDLLSTF